MKEEIQKLLLSALHSLQAAGELSGDLQPRVQVDNCRDPEHGDFASNLAMVLAKQEKRNPFELAEALVAALPASEQVESVTVARPGFINFKLNSSSVAAVVAHVCQARQQFGESEVGQGKRVHIEFVSANPTGPLHVGHGRGAAYGACVANLLRATGYQVHSEYYVNDAGRQIRILGFSAWCRYLELCGRKFAFPEGAYQGDYVETIAAALKAEHGERWLIDENKCNEINAEWQAITEKELRLDAGVNSAQELLGAEEFQVLSNETMSGILQDIREDLSEFGVNYDEWLHESRLISDGLLEAGLERLRSGGYIYEKDGAQWFRATDFGDEKDRVLIRENGQPTYFASDVAYHLYKYEQGYDSIIDVFGADHHGYIARIRAFLQGLGQDPERLQILLVQFAILYRGKEKVSMSTRSGQFVTLRELRSEVGNDAARYFYIMRRADQHLDFDLELAKSQSQENPVYYIQYAHARICSVFRQLAEQTGGAEWNEREGLLNLDKLNLEHERMLMTIIAKFPEVVAVAAERHEPHSVAYFLHGLATEFQSYYNAQRFLVEDQALTQARCCLIHAVRIVIANGLRLLGISAPEEM